MGADRTQIRSSKTTQQEKRVNAKCVFITKKKRGYMRGYIEKSWFSNQLIKNNLTIL